jgi:hypothetical protein
VEQQQSTRVRLVEDQQAANSDITEQELMRRKDFLEFGDDDVANLTKINDLASQYAASVIEDSRYSRIARFPASPRFSSVARRWCPEPFDRRELREWRCTATPAAPPRGYAQRNVGKGQSRGRCHRCRLLPRVGQPEPPITREADGSRATAGPNSAEGRDPGSDPLRQSSPARQYRRNRIRRASSIVRGAPVPAVAVKNGRGC